MVCIDASAMSQWFAKKKEKDWPHREVLHTSFSPDFHAVSVAFVHVILSTDDYE